MKGAAVTDPGDPGPESPPSMFAALGAVLLNEQSLDELLDLVVGLSRRAVHGADGVSVSLSQKGRFFTTNASDAVVRELDEVQYRLGDGPCVDAIKRGRLTSVSLDHSDDYPGFATAARQRFMTAVMSLPLATPNQGLGALNFYKDARVTRPSIGSESCPK